MNATRLKKKLTLAGIILTVGFTKPILNVSAATVNTYIDDNDELHNYYDNVTKEDLLNSLETNPYLSVKHKEYIKEFIEKAYNRYPNLDYTIFNQNLKSLKIIEMNTSEIIENNSKLNNNKINKDVRGYYLIYENEIYISNDIEYKEYILFHELWHAFSTIYIEDKHALKSPTYGFSYGLALEEGITTYLTNSICFDECLSYENQVSIVEILVEKYGEDVIFEYLDKGISEIVFKLSSDGNYNLANQFIKSMDKDMQNKACKTEIIDMYHYLIDIYLKDISNKSFGSIANFQKLITNLDYESEINKEILSYLKDNYVQIDITDEIRYIVFFTKEEAKVYLLDKIYVVRTINNEIYFVDTNIIKEYLSTGYIHNIYDQEERHYSDKPIIYSTVNFKDFIQDNLLNFINVSNNKIYVNTNVLDYKMYDKGDKSLTK